MTATNTATTTTTTTLYHYSLICPRTGLETHYQTAYALGSYKTQHVALAPLWQDSRAIQSVRLKLAQGTSSVRDSIPSCVIVGDILWHLTSERKTAHGSPALPVLHHTTAAHLALANAALCEHVAHSQLCVLWKACMSASFVDRKQSLEELIEAAYMERTANGNTCKDSVAILAQGIADLIVHSTLEGKQRIEVARGKAEQVVRPLDAKPREEQNTLVRNVRSIPVQDALTNAAAWLAVLRPSQPTPRTAQAWKQMLSMLRTQSLTSLCAADLQEVCAFFQEAKAASLSPKRDDKLASAFPSMLARARFERVLSLALVQYQAMLDRETANSIDNLEMLARQTTLRADQDILDDAKQALAEPEILDI